MWRQTFKMAALPSFRTEKCCHLVTAHEASDGRKCSSVRQWNSLAVQLQTSTLISEIFVQRLTSRLLAPLRTLCNWRCISLRTSFIHALLIISTVHSCLFLLWCARINAYRRDGFCLLKHYCLLYVRCRFSKPRTSTQVRQATTEATARSLTSMTRWQTVFSAAPFTYCHSVFRAAINSVFSQSVTTFTQT